MSQDQQQCVCGHSREAHEHYRRGTDCALCGRTTCPRFRRASLLAAVVGRRGPRRPADPEGHG